MGTKQFRSCVPSSLCYLTGGDTHNIFLKPRFVKTLESYLFPVGFSAPYSPLRDHQRFVSRDWLP